MLSLPHHTNRNIALFYILTILNNSWFVIGNWIFFWLRYMSYGQLGWIDAACFAFGMMMEIPTGAISDLVGKKKTLILAMALASLGFFLMATATEKTQIFIGFLIAQAGWAFYSGAAEALAYDTLLETKHQAEFDNVISTSTSLSIISAFLATIAGIFLYQWYFRATHLALAFTYFLAFIAAWFLREPKVDSNSFSLSGYFSQLSQGVQQLFQPALKKNTPLIFSLLGIYFMFSFGFVKPAVSQYFGFDATAQGVVFAFLGVSSAILVSFVPTMRQKLTDLQGLYLLNGLLTLGFALAALLTGWFGVLALICITTAGSLAQPWTSVVVNREIPSKFRATTLSTVSMITKIPYIIVAIVAGQMIQDGLLPTFNWAVTIFMIALMATNWVWLYHHDRSR
jgi:MFS family permease